VTVAAVPYTSGRDLFLWVRQVISLRGCCVRFCGLVWSILQFLGFVFVLPAKGGGPRLHGSAAGVVRFAVRSAKGVVISVHAWLSRMLLHMCFVS